MTTQPEALRLAEELDWQTHWKPHAAEMRRLHAVNQELLEALKDAASCVQSNYLPDKMGHDWDDVIAKAEGQV
jgi:predicted metallo-beta-lactamase superfamily hydrolase